MRLLKKFSLVLATTLLTLGIGSSVSFFADNKQIDTSMNHEVYRAAEVRGDSGKEENKLTAEEIKEDLKSKVKCTYSKISYSELSVYFVAKISTKSDNVYSVGYWGTDDKYMPAQIEIEVTDEAGKKLDQKFVGTVNRINMKSEENYLHANYKKSINLECSIEIPANTKVIEESIKLKNILFGIEKYVDITDKDGNVSKVPVVDLDFKTVYDIHVSSTPVTLTSELSEFIDIKPLAVTKLMGYHAVQLDVDVKLDIKKYLAIIDEVTAGLFNNRTNIKNLENGTTFINTRFTLTKNLSSFLVTEMNGTVKEVKTFPCDKSMEFGHNNIVLFVPSSEVNDIKDFVISKLMIQVSVITRKTNKEVANSQFDFRFGNVSSRINQVVDAHGEEVYPSHAIQYINADLITGMVFLGITLIYAIVAIATYFYKLNKYKDDEFKKVNTPQFIKISIYGYLFFIIMGLDALWLICRTNFYNNASMFANPLDLPIVLLTIASFLIAGYFLRRYYISFKETLEKNRREKLNLNAKQEDSSGTISTGATAVVEVPKEEQEVAHYKKNIEIEPHLYVTVFDPDLYKTYQEQEELHSKLIKCGLTQEEALKLTLQAIDKKELIKIADFAVLDKNVAGK